MITDKQLKSKISPKNDPRFFCLNVLLDQTNIYSTYSAHHLLTFKHFNFQKQDIKIFYILYHI